MKIRFFAGKFSFPLVAFLLLSIAVLPSSSGADGALLARTQGEIERLWSGVLGCAESGSSFTIRNRFNGSESTYGGGGGGIIANGESRTIIPNAANAPFATQVRAYWLTRLKRPSVREAFRCLIQTSVWIRASVGFGARMSREI